MSFSLWPWLAEHSRKTPPGDFKPPGRDGNALSNPRTNPALGLRSRRALSSGPRADEAKNLPGCHEQPCNRNQN